MTATKLSKRWLIGLAQAIATLKSTTQKIFRSSVLPLGKRYKSGRLYHLPRLPGDWYADTFHGRTKSKALNKYEQVFVNNAYLAAIYPMDTKKLEKQGRRCLQTPGQTYLMLWTWCGHEKYLHTSLLEDEVGDITDQICNVFPMARLMI